MSAPFGMTRVCMHERKGVLTTEPAPGVLVGWWCKDCGHEHVFPDARDLALRLKALS